MEALLIDDRGVVWPAYPETVARRFRATQGRDFHLYAIAHGFIFGRFNGFGTQIGLRPQFASRAALARLFGIVARRNPTRVALAYDARLASWEIISGAELAIARLKQLVAEAQNPSPRPLFTARRLPLEQCPDIAGGRMFPALQVWQQTQGRWEPNFYGRLLEWKLLPLTLISEQPPASDRLLVGHWGKCLAVFGKDWPSIAPGRDLEDQPNAEAGRWASAMQRLLIAERVPRLTAEDHVVRQCDGRLVRLRYYRLAMPWRTPERSTRVTDVMVTRRTIVLERQNPPN